MKDGFLITIDGVQRADGDADSVSLATLGSYVVKDGSYFISYNDTEATGFAGDVTTLRIDADKRVTLSRSGKANADLTIEKGQKHLCHYDTGFGAFTVGILASRIDNHLSKNGGELSLAYSLELNANTMFENELNITVRETSANA